MNDRKGKQAAKNYDVGYGKPPVITRWKPGHSGNPKGRRKKAQNLETIVNETLFELIEITVGGRKRRVPRIKVAVMRLAHKAAEGDLKAAKLVFDLLGNIDQPTGEAEPIVLRIFGGLPDDEWDSQPLGGVAIDPLAIAGPAGAERTSET